uniref:SWIM-type domain-containing protein n=1 Tax=Brassica oleracea TaxID=3712 RepID=A0A3P6CMT0_BRAOL|nr:unnamed protein product [Brassica oleracea]
MINKKSVRFSLVDVVKKGQHFTSKTALQATMKICAMKHNFDYKLGKPDKRVWYVRCADDDCRWHVRAERLTGFSYFIIKKYVHDHSCAPSSRNHSVRTTSSKTIGSLIMHKYESDTFECVVDLVRRTCSCGKFGLMKIPCRHAIKAAFSVGIQAHILTDDMCTTASWRSIYEESINPISVPEYAWIVPSQVQ